MAATMRRARSLLRFNQRDLGKSLHLARHVIPHIEQTRKYPSSDLINRFEERFQVNLYVYNWARAPQSADGLPGLLGLVPLHIIRLYEKRLVASAVSEGRDRPPRRRSIFEDLPSIV